MLTKRIIACLDVDRGRVVKGVHFVGLRDAGDPAELARAHAASGADEIVLLDISATFEGRLTLIDTVRRAARELYIPFTAGGGIRSLESAAAVIEAGADKVSVNSAALSHPDLITQIAQRFGSQAVVVAIDAAASGNGDADVFAHGGRTPAGRKALEWSLEAESRGAGEILLTAIGKDGTRSGFDCELTAKLAQSLRIPVIASGGAGNVQHFVDVFRAGHADAALAASIFHFGISSVGDLKESLQKEGIPVRWPC
ncbi:MAG: imidazole glycerol phosphate synthase subunit HisF [Candidatus Acidiferrales bacterium]